MTGFVTPLTREQPGKGRAAMLILEREGTGKKLKLKGWVIRKPDKLCKRAVPEVCGLYS